MRFQFCGNNSAAEWFLAESSIISKIVTSSIFSLLQNKDICQIEIGCKQCFQTSN